MVIFCDEVQAPSEFSYTTSCRCWHTCAPAWTNFGWLYRQGGRLNFNHMLCCCHRGVPTKLLSFDFNFAPTSSLRTDLRPRAFDVLLKALHVCVTFRAITYMLCAIGQCGLLGFPFRTSTSPPTKVACGVRGYAEIREDK
jgi:hypothetical protein